LSKYAIQVEGLGKEYIIGRAEQRHDSFREMATGALMAPLRKLRRLGGEASEEERFWALKEVSFKVEQGEVLGIVGRNGAGKSTLLKVLSRITSPTTGRVLTRGRVASLLEVGTGFHPELTGRENIYLNGAILGMSRAEIDMQFTDIVEFAEIDKFLDTPVKRYSSGMYVRLAFAVAAHLDTDVLVVDEVLAVGDQTFQRKCLGKMSDVARAGRTVIFVSHNMSAIKRLCSRAIVFARGTLVFEGDVGIAIDTYIGNIVVEDTLGQKISAKGPLSDRIVFESISLEGRDGGPKHVAASDTINVDVTGQCLADIDDLQIVVGVDMDGLRLFSMHDSKPGTSIEKGRFRSSFSIAPGQLLPGRYLVSVGAVRQIQADWCWAAHAAALEIEVSEDDTELGQGVVNIVYSSTRTPLIRELAT
jgi:lipopolysaccharide transport system ATP-binding protein